MLSAFCFMAGESPQPFLLKMIVGLDFWQIKVIWVLFFLVLLLEYVYLARVHLFSQFRKFLQTYPPLTKAQI
jgi:Na+/glutamate symporter